MNDHKLRPPSKKRQVADVSRKLIGRKACADYTFHAISCTSFLLLPAQVQFADG